MNVVTAVAQWLADEPDIAARADGGIHKYRLETEVAKTGLVGVVISVSGSWRRSDVHTAMYPRVVVRVHADASRHSNGLVSADDAYDRAMNLSLEIDRLLHRPGARPVMIGGLWILGTHREIEPSPIQRPGTDTVLFQTIYDMKAAA